MLNLAHSPLNPKSHVKIRNGIFAGTKKKQQTQVWAVSHVCSSFMEAIQIDLGLLRIKSCFKSGNMQEM